MSVRGRVLKVDPQGSDVLITIGVGSDDGVARDWHGAVVLGISDTPLAEVVLLRIDKHTCMARVALTVDQLGQNPYVRLVAP